MKSFFYVIFIIYSSCYLFPEKANNTQNANQQQIEQLFKQSEELQKDNPEKALEIIENALLNYQIDLFQKCELLKEKGNLLFKLNRMDEALQTFNEVTTLADDKKLDELKSKCIYNSAFIYRKKNQLEKAIQQLHLAEKIAQTLKDEKWLINIRKTLGDFYWAAGNAESALDYYLEAKSFYEKEGETKLLSATLNNLGNVYFKKGKIQEALNCYIASHELKRTFGSQLDIAFSLTGLGNVYWSAEQPEKALEYHQQAIDIYLSENKTDYLAELYNSLGMDYKALGDYNNALINYNKGLSYKNAGNIRTISSILNNAASIYIDLNEYANAIEFYLESEKLKKTINDQPGLAIIYKNLGYSYQKTGELEKAEEYYQKAEKISLETADLKLKGDADKGLSEIFYKKAQFRKAYDHLLAYIIVRDSLDESANQENINKLLTEFDSERKEREIELLTKDNEIQKLMVTKNRTLRNFLLGSLLLILIVAVIIFRTKQQQIADHKRIEEEIRRVNADLERRVQEELTKREKQQQLLIQKSKLESLGKLAAGIAHEINQPLGGISMGLENIQFSVREEAPDMEYINKKITLINGYIARISQIIDHVRIFSRDQQVGILEQIDLNEVVLSAIGMLLTQYSRHNVEFVMELNDKISKTVGNKFKLEQVIINLLTNAKDAVMEKSAESGTEYHKKIVIRTYMNDETVYLEVEDNGKGIPEETKSKIFDPFFTTKDPEKGTGLGLSIVYGILEEMKSTIEVDSSCGNYTIMRVKIPGLSSKLI